MTDLFEPSAELVDLGLALGVLTGTVEDPQLDNSFFENADEKFAGLLSNASQRDAVLRLLSRILDGAATPSTDSAEQWVPLVTTDTTPRLGLWGVVTERAGGVDFGLALLVRHDDDVSLDLSVVLPILHLNASGVASVLAGTAQGDIRISAGIELGDALALGDLSIDGFALSLDIPTQAGVDPTIEVRASVPPAGNTNDLVLDTSTDLGSQLVELLLRFGAAAAGDAADELAHVLDLLGLGTDPGIPAFPIATLFDDPVDALWGWVRSLATPATVTTWLGHIASLVGAPAVAGAGTPADPARLCADLGDAEVCLTLAVDTSGAAAVLVPGLSMTADAPAALSTGGRAELTATLARLTLGASPTAELAPSMSATVTIGDPAAAGDLVSGAIPGVGTCAVDAVRAGLRVGLDGVVPVLEAHGVDVGSAGTFDVLDLTDTDALLDVATAGLDAAITAILAQLGASETAEALLVLAGVRRPTGETEASWPEEVVLTDLFSDPLDALATYHRTVLAAGRWPVLGAHITRLLGTPTAADAATGSGTDLDPWRILLATTPVGTANLIVWQTTDADGTRLHLGVELVPASLPLTDDVAGPTFTLEARATLVSVRLAGPGGVAAPPDPAALGAVGAVAALTGGLVLDGDVVEIRADAIKAGLVWDRSRGLQPAVEVTGAALVVDHIPVPFDLPRLDPATSRWVFDAGIPWEAIERLLGAVLAASRDGLVRHVATLLGWDRPRQSGIPFIPPAPGTAASPASIGLPLEDLVADPVAALSEWAAELLSGPQAQEWAEELLGWVARQAMGASTGLLGSGGAADPWGAALGDRARLTATRGDAGAAPGTSVRPVPIAIADASDGSPSFPVTPELHVEALANAAERLPAVRVLVDRSTDVAATLADLRTALIGTDGLVPQTSQLALAGATTVVEQGIGLGTAAAAFRPDRHLPGGPAEADRVFVRIASAGVLDWPDVDPAKVIDLTDPTLSAPAFDLSAVSGAGPWFVVLPSRVATGAATTVAAHAELAARLTRVVVALVGSSGRTLALVATGAAGHVVRTVAAAEAAVTHIVTIGTAHGGAVVDLTGRIGASGFRMLQSLRGLISDPVGDLPLADELLRSLEAVLDEPAPSADGSPAPARSPVADTAPPGPLPPLGGVTATAVATVLTAADIDRAMAELTRYAMRASVDGANTAADEDSDRSGTALGWRADAVQPTPSAGPRLRVTVGPDLLNITPRDPGTTGLPISGPRLVVDAHLDRANGWLLGSATAGLRARAIGLHIAVGLGTSGVDTSFVLTVHDAGVFGITRTAWEIDLADASRTAHLTADERVLLGAALEALGPVPASGQVRALADLLASLGVVTIATDGTITVDPTTIENALVDLASIIDGATSSARTQAISAVESLLGGSSIDLGDELALDVELAPSSPAALTLRTTGDGISLGFGASVTGSLRVDITGAVSGSLAIGISSGTANHDVAISATIDTAATPVASIDLQLARPDGTAVRSIELVPTPDTDALLDAAVELAPALLARLALGAARDQVPAVAPLVQALGLGAPDEPIRLPATLFADPVAWFATPTPAMLVGLVDAVRTLTGGTGGTGTLDLPWGLRLTVAAAGGDVTASLGFPSPVTIDHTAIDADLTLTRTAAGELVAGVTTDVGILDDGGTELGGISFGIGTTISLAVRVGGITIPLLPSGPGLGALVAGATRALPLVLDLVATAPAPVGPAVIALGDALGLRASGNFVEAELIALGTDPANELVTRLRANISDGLDALELFVDPLFASPGVVDATSGVLTITPATGVAISIDLNPLALASPRPPRVCLHITDVEPVTGLSISGRACVSDGPDEFGITIAITDEDLLLGLLPAVDFHIGPATAHPDGQVEIQLWTAPPSDPGRTAMVGIVDIGAGSVAVRCREGAGDPHVDLGPCAADLITGVVVPRLLDLVLAADDVRDALETTVSGHKIGELLSPELLTRTTAGGVKYTVTDGAFDIDDLAGRALRTLVNGLGDLAGDIAIPALDPLTIGIATEDGRVGVSLGIERTKDLEIISGDGIRLAIEADARWVARALGEDPETVDGGIDLFLLTIPPAGSTSIVPDLDPRIAIRGVGLRVGNSDPSAKLLDAGLSIRSIGVHGWYERSFTGPPLEAGGGHIELDQLGLPVGDAGGNSVASSFVSGDDSGDPADAAPAFSPALSVYSTGSGVDFDLRAGEGDGPWWIPIQQTFGPIYLDQLGFGVGRRNGELESLSILLDGGASMAGLTLALDDLEVIIPWATPGDLTTWKLDLAGFAVGYSGSGLTLAGGMKKFDRNGNPDYVGMVQVSFPPYGATGVGGYGVFPDGASGEYTSFFAFVAVTAPIGGPPVFFVTGLGGGFGLNRELIAPDITEVETFPLVTAFTGGMADDPMGALETLGDTFPPKRGALWFAAGLSFTTFSLVNTTAVLTVALDGGLELNLLGLSKAQLPPAPAPPMASVELVLAARFSTAEALLSVQAQLTDNSWIVNESVRLTGGFAFIIWFRTGQFVFTIGGYGPAFDKPDNYPVVPRVGFSWTPNSKVTVKGGGYFCLTSSCIMAGAEVEVSYKSGAAWAFIEAEIHCLVSWDPFFYDFRFRVSVGAGISFKVFGKRVSLSFEFTVSVHIQGPKLRGTATLDLDITSVTVRFGPSSTPNTDARIGWDTFVSDYVLEPPSDSGTRHALAASVTKGALIPGVGEKGGSSAGEADPDDADDGTAAKPWRVVPEFAMAVQTRTATTQANAIAMHEDVPATVAAGPHGVSGLASTLFVSVKQGSATMAIDMEAEYGYVPEAVWAVVSVEPDVAEEELIFACVGIRFEAIANVQLGVFEIEVEGTETSDVVHPLPFAQERRASRRTYGALRDASRVFEESIGAAARGKVAEIVGALVTEADADVADHRLSDQRLLDDRVAPPMLRSVAHGIAETERPRVRTKPDRIRIPERSTPTVSSPRLEAVLRRSAPLVGLSGVATAAATAARTTVGNVRGERVAPPTLAGVSSGNGVRLGATLTRTPATAAVRRGVITPASTRPETAVAGRGTRRLLASTAGPENARLAKRSARQFTSARGTSIRPGDTQVWVRDGVRHDRNDDRPAITVKGTARVVAVDEGGDRLLDHVVESGSVDIPLGAARIAVTGGDTGSGASGWTATESLAEIADGTWLATRSTVRAAGSRGGSRANRSSVVRARSALARAGRIDTDLPGDIRTVVVALDGNDGPAPALAIEGAAQTGAVRVVRQGGAVVLVAGVKPTHDVVTVGVAPNEGTVVGGVVGSPLDPDTVVRTLGTSGLIAVAPTATPTGPVASVTWKEPR